MLKVSQGFIVYVWVGDLVVMVGGGGVWGGGYD